MLKRARIHGLVDGPPIQTSTSWIPVEIVTAIKSTYSNNGGNCVEVASDTPSVVAVRDSKDPDGPKLAFTPAEWKAFTSTVKG